MEKRTTSWWRHVPRPGCPYEHPLVHPLPHQKPVFAVGDTVRLVGKPDKPPAVLAVHWHTHCHDFVYAAQLVEEEERQRRPG